MVFIVRLVFRQSSRFMMLSVKSKNIVNGEPEGLGVSVAAILTKYDPTSALLFVETVKREFPMVGVKVTHEGVAMVTPAF